MAFSSRQRSKLRRSDIAVFENMRTADFARLAAASPLIECHRQNMPLHGIDVGKTVIIVCKGILGLQQTLSDGRRSLTELFHIGDILDFRRNSRRFQGDLVCLAKSRFCALNADVLDEISNSDLKIRDALQNRQREQMHFLRDHCFDIGKKTPNERIASFLFEQLTRVSGDIEDKTSLRITVSKKLIGEYLALRSETVSRAFSFLDDAGFISHPSRNVVQIVDTYSLKQIANGSMPRSTKHDISPRHWNPRAKTGKPMHARSNIDS